jgi:lipopolysaccharide export LptBFGC system permease protein LptF
LETDVRWKLWLGGVVALLLAGCLCLVSPRLGGAALILLALGAVGVFAYRML